MTGPADLDMGGGVQTLAAEAADTPDAQITPKQLDRREYHRLYRRRRYAEDPEFREAQLRNNRESYRRRVAEDPEYLERKRTRGLAAKAQRKRQIRSATPRIAKLDKKADIELGSHIKRLRLARHMKVSDVSRQIGISPKQLLMYESGKTRMTAGAIWYIAQTIGVSIEDIFSCFDHSHSNILDNTADAHRLREISDVSQAYWNIKNQSTRLSVLVIMQDLSDSDRISEIPNWSEKPDQDIGPDKSAEHYAET